MIVLSVLLQETAQQLGNASPLVFLTMFGAGLATSLTPCVYPMIPITAGIVAGNAGASANKWRALVLTLTYVSGLALLYATLGLLAGMTGTIFGTVSANPWVRFATANILLLLGLSMLDILPTPVPHRLMKWAAGFRGGSLIAVFALGAVSGIVAAPCGAPIFAAVLTWVATTGSPVLGFLYLLVFSAGMTALLIVVGVFSGSLALLPKSGPWLAWIKRGSGIVMLGVAEYYLILVGMGL